MTIAVRQQNATFETPREFTPMAKCDDEAAEHQQKYEQLFSSGDLSKGGE